MILIRKGINLLRKEMFIEINVYKKKLKINLIEIDFNFKKSQKQIIPIYPCEKYLFDQAAFTKLNKMQKLHY